MLQGHIRMTWADTGLFSASYCHSPFTLNLGQPILSLGQRRNSSWLHLVKFEKLFAVLSVLLSSTNNLSEVAKLVATANRLVLITHAQAIYCHGPTPTFPSWSTICNAKYAVKGLSIVECRISVNTLPCLALRSPKCSPLVRTRDLIGKTHKKDDLIFRTIHPKVATKD